MEYTPSHGTPSRTNAGWSMAQNRESGNELARQEDGIYDAAEAIQEAQYNALLRLNMIGTINSPKAQHPRPRNIFVSLSEHSPYQSNRGFPRCPF